MSDLDALLDSIVGDDEWSRHRALERLREDGAPPERVAALADDLHHVDASRRSAARMALAALASPGSGAAATALAVLLDRLDHDDADVRVLAASALGEAGSAAAGPGLVRALDDPEPNVAAAAADALGQLGYAPALEGLAAAARSGSFWVRAAAVVALGRLEDERAIPPLLEAARSPGLERPLVEAIREIHHPDGLDVLAVIQETAPREALVAAGAILAAHPDLEPPAWVKERAATEAEGLRAMLVEEDDPAVARVLGIAATPSALDTLLALVGPPRRSEAALTGVLAVPPERRSSAIIARLPDADRDEMVALLSLLPPQADEACIEALVPLLSHEDATVRAAAAEALARAPAQQALPLLAHEIDRKGVAPEVVRALGSLGESACGALLPLLEDPTHGVRAAAAEALTRCGGPAVADAVGRALEAEDHADARRALLRALGRAGGGSRIRLLVDALEDPDPDTRLAAIEGLGATASPDAMAPLEQALDGERHERLAALRALGDLGLPATATVLEAHLRSGDTDERRTAASAAVEVSGRLHDATLDALYRDEDEWVRVWAARMLARRGDAGRARLRRMAEEDSSPAVRSEARRALSREE